jgi:hypothetical protein
VDVAEVAHSSLQSLIDLGLVARKRPSASSSGIANESHDFRLEVTALGRAVYKGFSIFFCSSQCVICIFCSKIVTRPFLSSVQVQNSSMASGFSDAAKNLYVVRSIVWQMSYRRHTCT